MKVLIVAPGMAPVESDIRNELEELQAIVGGWIEIVEIEHHVVLICDEEGKLKNKKENRFIPELGDVIVGRFAVAGSDDEGELTDLPEEVMQKYKMKWRV